MLILDNLLLSPLLWIFREINESVQKEQAGEAEAVTRALSELYMKLDAGAITEQEFEAEESVLLDRLDAISERDDAQAADSDGDEEDADDSDEDDGDEEDEDEDEDDGDDEDPGSQGFGRNALSIAAISGYFIPILEGRLEVLVEDHVGSHRINRETYQVVLTQIEGSSDERLKGEVKRFRAYLEVAESANKGQSRDYSLPPCNTTKPEWSPDSLSEVVALDMREALATGALIRVKATVTVRPKDGDVMVDSFECLVRKQDGFSEKPCHIREDLIIPDVVRSNIHGFVCLVRVNRGALATLLGDSENPSHTEWQKDSKNFKGKYTYGGVVIEYVSSFAHELVRRIHTTSRQLDRKLLVDLFYDEVSEPVSDATKPKPPKPAVINDPIVPPELESSGLRITETQDGFSMGSVGAPYPPGTLIAVNVAYETSKGNPFKAYKPYDFDLGDDEITAKITGCTIMERKGNKIVVVIQEAKFLLHVTGFDINRDLVVKAKPERTDVQEAILPKGTND